MDFKGHVPCGAGRCHPLTVLDDHSRYSLVLAACGDERTATVSARLSGSFRRYGLPEVLLVDNGPPWGGGAARHHTPLTVWLLRLGVRVVHSRPRHPQTLGKDERFHRTRKAELLGRAPLEDLASAQRRFDAWRHVYNHERPHEALALATPASRYRPSERSFPETLPPVEYPAADHVRKVQAGGRVDFRGRRLRAPQAFTGQRVALRPRSQRSRSLPKSSRTSERCFPGARAARDAFAPPPCEELSSAAGVDVVAEEGAAEHVDVGVLL